MDPLGTRIARARMAAGLTQATAAKLCGVAVSTIHAWEQGTFHPSSANLVILAERLRVRVSPRPKPEKPTTERRCLTCRKVFASEWIGHRICDSCKDTAAFREGDTEFSIASTCRARAGAR